MSPQRKKVKMNNHTVKVEYPLDQLVNRQELINEVLAAAKAEQNTQSRPSEFRAQGNINNILK